MAARLEGRGRHLRQDRLGVGLRLLVVLGVDQRGQQREVDVLLLQIDAQPRLRAFLLDARGPVEQRRAVELALAARVSGRPRPTRKIEP